MFSKRPDVGSVSMSVHGNERLRVAMASRNLEVEALARHVGVDPKTVQRWLTGRVPHPRHRWKACDALNRTEEELWPEVALANASGLTSMSEIVTAYTHRADAPIQLWSNLIDRASTTIDLLGYAMLFLPEQFPDLEDMLDKKCKSGLRVRILAADPMCEEVAARDRLEDLRGTLPGRIRTTLGHFEPLLSNPGIEVRLHTVPLYNAVYRFDDQMIVTPYLYKLHGFQHPLLQLRRRGSAGIFEAYARQFEAVWAEFSAARWNPTQEED